MVVCGIDVVGVGVEIGTEVEVEDPAGLSDVTVGSDGVVVVGATSAAEHAATSTNKTTTSRGIDAQVMPALGLSEKGH